MRIVVIGSGFGGLGAAIRLRARGHDVTIVDKLAHPGGAAQVHHQDGFTLDAAPSFITAPWLIQELFDLAGKRTADYLSLVPLEPFYSVRFEDGAVFHYSGLADHLAREIRKFTPSDVTGYLRLRTAAARMFEAGFPLAGRPLSSARDAARVLPELVRLRAYRSIAALVDDCISDERLRRVFSVSALSIGGAPARTPAIYAMLQTLEQRWGVWYAMGGTGAVVRALVRLFGELGGVLRLATEVTEIAINGPARRATGVRLASGEIVAADAVVTGADVASTYLNLVPASARTVESDRRIQARTYSPSRVVLCFGTDRRYPDLAHHEILVGTRETTRETTREATPATRNGARSAARRKGSAATSGLPHEFTLVLHRPTATDPSLAPAGCDAWCAVTAVPNLGAGTDWTIAAQPYRDAIVQYLELRYLPGLSQHIVAERCIDPLYFRDSLNCHLGSAFSAEPTRKQTGCFRPHNQSPDVRNLYCVGAGTHPGAGLPGVLLSGKIAAQLIGDA